MSPVNSGAAAFYDAFERMNVTQIEMQSFRNHAQTHIEFGPGINALLGNNGQGKTSVLEAIAYLSLTKSFYAAHDATALQIGKESFCIQGTVVSNGGATHEVRVVYRQANSEKEVLVNRVRPETLTSVIGRFPVVILSPENSTITTGPPSERRKFLDLVLSQMGRSYLEDLLEYRRALRQRNQILLDARMAGSVRRDVLDSWSEALVQRGGRLMQRRGAFLREFHPRVLTAYRHLVAEGEAPGMEYLSNVEGAEAENTEGIARAFRSQMEGRFAEEIRRGTTLVGPHRDDLLLTINESNVQKYASQGQHKTFLVALKMAEFSYLKDQRNESPIFLLDDVFSEMDEHRTRRILAFVTGLGQTIITATGEELFRKAVPWNDLHRRFYVESGTCRPC